MHSYQEQIQIIQNYHEMGETIAATEYLIEQYGLYHPNFKGIELREPAKPEFFLMTAEGIMGEPQVVKIPENTYEFPLDLVLNLLAHEMVHVGQKTKENLIEDKNEREWQAYYEMLFHIKFPLIPNAPDFYRKQFVKKAFDYYNRMGENSELQQKYANQKKEIELLMKTLS